MNQGPIHGFYHEPCEKIAYSTEVYARAALKRCQSLGRDEHAFYHCPECHLFHLTSSRQKLTLDIEPIATLRVGPNTLDLAKTASSLGERIVLRLAYRAADSNVITRTVTMQRDQAVELLDALIVSLYNNSENNL